ncbi:MAG: hypothetical protein IPJ30_13035 [Acidobacteria bacterium]|nr:hypothetical protein [Acidobacteriota bacterium]
MNRNVCGDAGDNAETRTQVSGSRPQNGRGVVSVDEWMHHNGYGGLWTAMRRNARGVSVATAGGRGVLMIPTVDASQ